LWGTSEESAVDQRPHHDHTRLAIDAQQAPGLCQRDAESWHFGVLGLDPAGQISNGCVLYFGFWNCARHHEPTSPICLRHSKGKNGSNHAASVARKTEGIPPLPGSVEAVPEHLTQGDISV
jgi:hypothetical protein